MMAVFVEVFGTFGLTISESKTETMCMPISRAPATEIVLNATGQEYRQTTSFTYLGGSVIETLNLSNEINLQIRAGWIAKLSHLYAPCVFFIIFPSYKECRAGGCCQTSSFCSLFLV